MSTLQTKIDKLRSLVDWFESDDMDIDETMQKYEAVKQLTAEIEASLNDLETNVTVVRDEFGDAA